MVSARFQHISHAIVITAIVAVLGLAGCASGNAVRGDAPGRVGEPGKVGFATIVAIRDLVLPEQGLGAYGAVLPAGAVRIAGRHAGQSSAEMEFIIREDDGRTLSVVQRNTDGFRPGQRVALVHGAQTRLAPA